MELEFGLVSECGGSYLLQTRLMSSFLAVLSGVIAGSEERPKRVSRIWNAFLLGLGLGSSTSVTLPMHCYTE